MHEIDYLARGSKVLSAQKQWFRLHPDPTEVSQLILLDINMYMLNKDVTDSTSYVSIQNLTAKTNESWIPCSMNMSDAVGIGWRAIFAWAPKLLRATRAQLVVGTWPTKPLRINMARRLLIVCVMKNENSRKPWTKRVPQTALWWSPVRISLTVRSPGVYHIIYPKPPKKSIFDWFEGYI